MLRPCVRCMATESAIKSETLEEPSIERDDKSEQQV